MNSLEEERLLKAIDAAQDLFRRGGMAIVIEGFAEGAELDSVTGELGWAGWVLSRDARQRALDLEYCTNCLAATASHCGR